MDKIDSNSKAAIIHQFWADESIIPTQYIGNFNLRHHRGYQPGLDFGDTTIINGHEFNETDDGTLFTAESKHLFFNEAKKRWQNKKLQAIQEFFLNKKLRGRINPCGVSHIADAQLIIPNYDGVLYRSDIQNDGVFDQLYLEIKERVIYDQYYNKRTELVQTLNCDLVNLTRIKNKYQPENVSSRYNYLLDQATEELLALESFRDYVEIKDFENFSNFSNFSISTYKKIALLLYHAIHVADLRRSRFFRPLQFVSKNIFCQDQQDQFKYVSVLKKWVRSHGKIPAQLVVTVYRAKIEDKPSQLCLILYCYFLLKALKSPDEQTRLDKLVKIARTEIKPEKQFEELLSVLKTAKDN